MNDKDTQILMETYEKIYESYIPDDPKDIELKNLTDNLVRVASLWMNPKDSPEVYKYDYVLAIRNNAKLLADALEKRSNEHLLKR